MTIAEQKKKLREHMLIKRGHLDQQEKEEHDQWICHQIWDIIRSHGFKQVHCYLPMGTEINIFPLIEKMLAEHITVISPKTRPKRRLQHLILESITKLEKGVFGTSHPACAEEFSGDYDLIIVPGLAFNAAKYRLGYGGGYYDNFMNQYPNAHKLGIGYPFQKAEQIPLESHDVRLDEVLFAKS